MAAANGVASFDDISLDKAAAYTLGTTDGSLAGATSGLFSVGELAITQLPASVVAGSAIPLAAMVQRPNGKTIAADESQVTLSIKKGPAGATLTGTTQVAAANGVATFTGLSLTKAGTYRLVATDGGISIKSFVFTVSPGHMADLSFVAAPPAAIAGEPINPGVSVSVTDAFGNAISGASVTLAIGKGHAHATLSGTMKIPAQNGMATFSDLSLTQTGNYTLKATHGKLAPVKSSVFAVAPGAAAQLVFAEQPSAAAVRTAITPAVVVDLEDSFGNLATGNESDVTLSINPGSGPAGAVLRGTLNVTATNGVATFSDLWLNEAGTYELRARDGNLARAKSVPFNILAGS